MISIQRIHIYLKLSTYYYDGIFNDRFWPLKTPDLELSGKFIATLFIQSRTSHTHESERNSKQGANACTVVSLSTRY